MCQAGLRFEITLMNTLPIFLFACILLFQWGCSSTSYQSEESRYSFLYNDQEYAILSRSLITGKSVNYLLMQGRDALLLSARDDNIDGVLDTLLIGDSSLENANTVYSYGMALAVTEGKYRQNQPSRVYYQRTEEGFYAIQTYEQSPSIWYNRFIIYDAVEKNEIILLDRNADGILNQIEAGNADLNASQPLYRNFLKAGVEAGQIVNINGSFVVELPPYTSNR